MAAVIAATVLQPSGTVAQRPGTPEGATKKPAAVGAGKPEGLANKPSAAAGPLQPARKKKPGEPVRLAVVTVAVNTSVFVQAYDRFRKLHGPDKLVLDLWVEQDWVESPKPLEFAPYDMVLGLRCSIPGLDEALAAAAAKGVWVVSDTSRRRPTGAVSLNELADLAPYYRNRGLLNMVGFLERVCQVFGVSGVEARKAVQAPAEGIYHPDADRVFSTAADYWKWYAARPGYKPEAPKIGVFVYNTLYLNEETDYFTQVVRGLERAGASPVLGFWFLPVGGSGDDASPIRKFFSGVDVLMTSSFRLMNEKACHYEELEKLDVPVLNSIILNTSHAQWRESRQGLPASSLLSSIIAPELSGLIEPTVIAARQPVDNPETKQRYFRTVIVEENFQWQIRRAMAWARLRRAKPADRRVAVLFYNHSGGKQSAGASYLNVTASLEKILADLVRQGYRVDGKLQRESILDAMQSVGRNVGNWAPGEIDGLVQKGAVLWPLEKYLAHFDRLPQEAKRQVCQQWGQPPGDVMTVTRDSKQYFVLPVFQLGNIVVGPQPARASGQKQASAYHDPLLWPTHQYLAFYFWLQHEWHANAVVHLGRHGTLEFLPGKGIGLAWDDPPSLLLGDLPNVYPYIVDGIGEGVAAKRRGQAVLLTHATPPLVSGALFGDLAKLRELVGHYAQARQEKQEALKAEYFQSILKLAKVVGCDLAVDRDEDHRHDDTLATRADSASPEDRQVHRVEHWLADVESQSGPRGLHTFGESFSAEATADMLPRMFKDELGRLRKSGMKPEEERTWLAATAKADATKPPQMPEEDPDSPPDPAEAVAIDRARIATAAWHMRHNQELGFLSRALAGRFIPVGPPGDPLSNPDIFPTGRNQYQSNPQRLPTREAWAVGKRMAEQTIAMHRRSHGGEYPGKLSFALWANTLIRTHGVLESEALCLLGAEPVWNDRGDVTDVKLIAPLGRPRVDVVMTITGMYRDCFPDKMLLLDKAVRLAHDAPDESGQPNPIRLNTEKIARELAGRGADPGQSKKLAMLRIFGAQTGQYSTGVDGAVKASEQRGGSAQVAAQYMRRMSFAFSQDGWSQPAEEVFQRQLRGVQGVIHGRSSNLYGIMDLTENFEYQGALALAVKQIDGKQPALYLNDMVRGQKVFGGREAIQMELLSRYHNPEFIKSMKAEGYDGARYLSRVVDNQYGWNVVSDVVTADDWKQSAEIFLEDKYRLGLREFFNRHNPHALQNIASRILETHRKGLHKLDAKTLDVAARVYVETVAEHGAACASHICGNPELATLAAKVAGASHQLADGTIEKFNRQLQRTGNPEMSKALASAGASDQPATAPRPVEGKVLTPSSPPPQPHAAAAAVPPPSTPKVDSMPAASSQAASSDAMETDRSKPWLVSVLAGVVCLLAFTSGVVWRARRNRRIGSCA